MLDVQFRMHPSCGLLHGRLAGVLKHMGDTHAPDRRAHEFGEPNRFADRVVEGEARSAPEPIVNASLPSSSSGDPQGDASPGFQNPFVVE